MTEGRGQKTDGGRQNAEYRTMNTELENQQSAISNQQSQGGFSLTEVLLAMGTLAVGMLFIAGVFPVSIHFTTVSSERTIAAAVADEAFAKIKLYDINPAAIPVNSQLTIENVPLKTGGFIQDVNTFAYPSTPTADPNSKRYWWSAICRRVGPADVQVTVFVSRKVGIGTHYYSRNPLSPPNLTTTPQRPVLVYMSVGSGSRPDELVIIDSVADTTNEEGFISDGFTVVDDGTGQIYRVLEKYSATPNMIRLDKYWQGGSLPGLVWTVPPPVAKGRYPCIAVFQKVMSF
jgi:Tfp pilus assembly protein PilV